MKNGGHITVFLSIMLLIMLVLGLSAVEVIRVSMGSAKAAEAAHGAACDVQAAYSKKLFEDYHLLAIDKEFGGQGEGKIEQMAEDYLAYTLKKDTEDGMDIDQVALSGYSGLIENNYAEMKRQISKYMEMYAGADGVSELADMMTKEDDAGSDSIRAIENGMYEEADDESDWSGTDPRQQLKNASAGGLLAMVVPDGRVPSHAAFDISDVQQEAGDEWEDIDFDNLEELTNVLSYESIDTDQSLVDNFYGIYYALEFFNCYTSAKCERTLECEVEYMISGKNSDYANLGSVVNKIILHRFPVVFAYIITDSDKVAQVSRVALALSVIPGVSYAATKYLLLGCWAYAETLADIRVLLAGNHISFLKTDATWITDINDLGKLTGADDIDYDGVDAVDYTKYLALLLAENPEGMYRRIANLIQLELGKEDDTFRMSNLIYEFSIDVSVKQKKKFVSFIENFNGVSGVEDGCYVHEYRITMSY